MTDPVSNVSASDASTASGSDSEVLGNEFQKMLLKGGLMMMQNIQSDATDSLSDSTSDPDAPF
ncbi:hypothetical protein [Acetobacter okinawensis]|uniref:Uncharacterized protein n=1 Tax=Acetobacter okinawensis TaxID=1076594 RepID=A0A252BVB6_9PROT|nr:hypothetical protein [Acetobacter okinawensis]OUJ12884.1 hypothetical protein HK26_13535 [Acetobacter okinawensis]